MIGRYCLDAKADYKSKISFTLACFVNTGFLTGEFCVLSRQAELRADFTVAFHAANFCVGDARSWVH